MIDLIEFTGEQLIFKRWIRLKYTFHSTISIDFAKELGIKDVGYIKFYSDKKNPKKWYVSVDKKGHRVTYYEQQRKYPSYRFSCQTLVKVISNQYKLDSSKASYKFNVGDPIELEGKKYYPLLLDDIYYGRKHPNSIYGKIK